MKKPVTLEPGPLVLRVRLIPLVSELALVTVQVVMKDCSFSVSAIDGNQKPSSSWYAREVSDKACMDLNKLTLMGAVVQLLSQDPVITSMRLHYQGRKERHYRYQAAALMAVSSRSRIAILAVSLMPDASSSCLRSSASTRARMSWTKSLSGTDREPQSI